MKEKVQDIQTCTIVIKTTLHKNSFSFLMELIFWSDLFNEADRALNSTLLCLSSVSLNLSLVYWISGLNLCQARDYIYSYHLKILVKRTLLKVLPELTCYWSVANNQLAIWLATSHQYQYKNDGT